MLHPVVVGAMALLVVNDHVLKQAWPGFVTGKLSDVAGLVFFPVLLWSLTEVAMAGPMVAAGLRARLVAIALTGAVFALVKTCAPAAALYGDAIGALQWPVRALVTTLEGAPAPPFARASVVVDPSDLLALPALFVPWWIARRRAVAGAP